MKKNGLKIAAVIIAAISALALSSCSSGTASPVATPAGSAPAGSPAAKTGLKLAATFPVLDQYLQKVADAMQKEAAATGNTINIQSAQGNTTDGDASLQLSQVKAFIAQGVDGVMIIPVDSSTTGAMDSVLQQAGTQFVYVNRMPKDLASGVSYVGSDEKLGATTMAQYLVKQMENKGNVAIMEGDPASQAALDRTSAATAVFQQAGIKILDTQNGMFMANNAFPIAQNWITAYHACTPSSTLTAISSNNDDMATGIVSALKKAGCKPGDVLVSGSDATAQGQDLIKQGWLVGSMFQDATGQGAGGVDALINQISGGAAKNVDVPYELVTTDNVASFAGK